MNASCSARDRTRGLDSALPDDFELFPGIDIVFTPYRLLIPDLAVMTCLGVETTYYDSADLFMAIEIISPSSRVYDKIEKAALFAEAAIPYYLAVDPVPKPAQAALFKLEGDGYAEVATSEDGRLQFVQPFPVDFELP